MADTPTDTPADLITVKDAATLVDRSVSSVRAWLRAGKLAKHRENDADPNSRVLISRAELMTFAAVGLSAAPPRPPATSEAPSLTPDTPADQEAPAVALARAQAELRGALAVLEATRAHVSALEGQVAATEKAANQAREEARATADAERRRADAAERQVAELRDALTAARAELEALKEYADLPWYRRLIAGPSTPRIEA
jgi:hypothetical protein